MKNPPVTVSITLFLIVLDALLWFAFAVITASGAHPAIPDGDLYRWGMSILAFVTSFSLIILIIISKRRGGVAYYLLLGMLFLISILTITDEFGLVDLMVLVLHVIAFLLLLKDKAFYLQRNVVNLK